MSDIFLFHRDLRITDNTTLISQLKNIKKSIIPIFIFTPEQIDPKKNKYFSNNSVQFLIESLLELDSEIKKKGGKLYFFKGKTMTILNKIHKLIQINSIGYNIDYTPYARKRDDEIKKWCDSKQIKVFAKEDYALYDFLDGQTKNKTGKPYLVYTPFFNNVSKNLKVRSIDSFSTFKFKIENKLDSFTFQKINSFYTPNPNINVHGGRRNSLKILNNLDKFKNYNNCRNFLTYQTTFLSAYLHYTTCSIREVYFKIIQKLGNSSGLIRELVFRDFYMNIVFFFPHTLEGQIKGKNKSFQKKFDKIPWTNSLFTKWCEAKTGFPIVDAAMIQMKTTGFMHNRCRMIVSNFLVKDLHVDWKLGEQYFATQLEDYDPINNSSGWQWSTGNGTDAQPWFRIFNPWTQQKNYDKDCQYIKHWIPQLKDIPPSDIHKWCDENIRKKYPSVKYPAPIVNHNQERQKTLEIFKKHLS